MFSKQEGSTQVMSPVTIAKSLGENVAATLTSAKLTTNNTIALTFNEDVKNPQNIKLTSGTTEVATTGATASGKTVTITLASALDQLII